jgi:hypothetical protein
MEKSDVAMQKTELKTLTDQELHQEMVCTSQKEREVTAFMINMISEAAKRRFYLDLGFGTLFDYLTLGLHYSSAGAQRRISAARVAEELPEVKAQILDGSLTLSTLAQAEKFFRNEKKQDHPLELDQKKSVLQRLANKSSREVEKTLLQMSSAPEQLQPEKIKPMSAELTQITLNANSEFMALLEESRGLLGHQMPGASIAEVLAEMMKLGLGQLKKKKFKIKASTEPLQEAQLQEVKAEEKNSDVGSETASVEPQKESISNAVKRAVYMRDRGRCVVVNPRTGKPCGAQAFLEYDHHPIPRAKGGSSTVSNLRLTCRACNRLHAVHSYGREHVLKHLE